MITQATMNRIQKDISLIFEKLESLQKSMAIVADAVKPFVVDIAEREAKEDEKLEGRTKQTAPNKPEDSTV